MESLINYFGSLAGMMALVLLITEWIVKIFKVENRTWKHVISWIIAVGSSCIGYLGSYGIFEVYVSLPTWEGWTFTVLTGIGIGLASNGLYTVEVVKKILDAIMLIIQFIADIFTKKENK